MPNLKTMTEEEKKRRKETIEAFAKEFNDLCRKYRLKPYQDSSFPTLTCSFKLVDRFYGADYSLMNDRGDVFTLSEPWPG